MSGLKKTGKMLAAVVIVLVLIVGGVKLFTHGTGLDYYPEDKPILKIDGGDLYWQEYYGWLSFAAAQAETLVGEISDWDEDSGNGQTYAQYVKNYALHLIKIYKSVESTAAVVSIEVTDEERQEIANSYEMLTDAEKEAVVRGYGSVDFYKYLTELSLLYNKCHDTHYGVNGEKGDEEYSYDYATENDFLMFKGLFIASEDDENALKTAQELLETVEKTADKEAEIAKLRKEREIDDGYDAGYIVNTDSMTEECIDTLRAADTGECVLMEAEDGVWIALRCDISPDAMIYGVDATLRDQASWSVFASVVDGWGENLQVISYKVYDEIDAGKIFG